MTLYSHQAVQKWVNFNSSGGINRHHGISSVSDNGTGDFTINFSGSFTDSYYCINGLCGNQSQAGVALRFSLNASTSSGSCRVRTAHSWSYVDCSYNSLTFAGHRLG